MCKNSYIKENLKTNRKMIYCHCFDNEIGDMNKLCLYQRFCAKEDGYIFNDEKRCKKFE